MKSIETDKMLMEFIREEVNSKEQEGIVRHLPSDCAMLSLTEVAFGEIVRDIVLDKCMFNIVSPAVRNFVLD